MIQARKRFGQHFLHDPGVIERIARAVSPGPADHLLEIGPGRGALTQLLLAGPYASFDARRDRSGSGRRPAPHAWRRRVRPRCTSAMPWISISWHSRGSAAGRLRVIGNLPYNISTPLLFRLIDAAPAILDLHVMLQREVVARMAAAPGTWRLWTADRDAGPVGER